eukprot:3932120-Rhodomonas_salina.3
MESVSTSTVLVFVTIADLSVTSNRESRPTHARHRHVQVRVEINTHTSPTEKNRKSTSAQTCQEGLEQSHSIAAALPPSGKHSHHYVHLCDHRPDIVVWNALESAKIRAKAAPAPSSPIGAQKSVRPSW